MPLYEAILAIGIIGFLAWLVTTKVNMAPWIKTCIQVVAALKQAEGKRFTY